MHTSLKIPLYLVISSRCTVRTNHKKGINKANKYVRLRTLLYFLQFMTWILSILYKKVIKKLKLIFIIKHLRLD